MFLNNHKQQDIVSLVKINYYRDTNCDAVLWKGWTYGIVAVEWVIVNPTFKG